MSNKPKRKKAKCNGIKRLLYDAIPPKSARYPTVGDYVEFAPGDWRVRVSDTGDWRYNLLVAVHEIIELGLTQHAGVSEPQIKAFDERFEKSGAGEDDEPGDARGSPYRKQHAIAEGVERILAAELGVDWLAYGEACARAWRKAGGK